MQRGHYCRGLTPISCTKPISKQCLYYIYICWPLLNYLLPVFLPYIYIYIYTCVTYCLPSCCLHFATLTFYVSPFVFFHLLTIMLCISSFSIWAVSSFSWECVKLAVCLLQVKRKFWHTVLLDISSLISGGSTGSSSSSSGKFRQVFINFHAGRPN